MSTSGSHGNCDTVVGAVATTGAQGATRGGLHRKRGNPHCLTRWPEWHRRHSQRGFPVGRAVPTHRGIEVAALVLTSYLDAANREYADMVVVTVVVVVVVVAPTVHS